MAVDAKEALREYALKTTRGLSALSLEEEMAFLAGFDAAEFARAGDLDYHWLRIGGFLEAAVESPHICGFALTYVLERAEWICELGADACGELRGPIRVAAEDPAVAVARAWGAFVDATGGESDGQV